MAVRHLSLPQLKTGQLFTVLADALGQEHPLGYKHPAPSTLSRLFSGELAAPPRAWRGLSILCRLNEAGT